MAEWFDALDDEMKGHVSANSWQGLTADQAAAAAVKAHMAALKVTPTLPSNAVVIPTDPADKGWEAVHKALGVPADKAEYKFDNVVLADGKKLEDAALMDQFRAMAAKLHLTPKAAEAMAQDLISSRGELDTRQAAAQTAARNEQIAVLRNQWGGNFDHNKMIADRALGILGLTPETFEAMARTAGYDKVMNDLLKVGTRLGEATFHASTNPGGPSAASPQERKDELMADDAWTKKYLAGDREAVADMLNLNRAIVAARMAR